MSFADERVPEAEFVAPAGSYVDVEESAPKTEPGAAPEPEGLDLLLLSEARRLIGEAERYTAAGMHAVALPDARRALRVLALVIAKHDGKGAVVQHLTGAAAE